MSLIKIFALTAATCAFAQSVIASKKQETNKKKQIETLAYLQKELDHRQDMIKLNIAQELYRDFRKKTTKSDVVAYFKRKGKHFLWERSQAKGKSRPKSAQYWLFNGELFQWSSGDKTAIKYNSRGHQAKELYQVVEMILNFKVLLQSYELQDLQKSNFIYTIKLKPKRSGEIVYLLLTVDDKKKHLSQLEISYRSKNRSTFKFSSPIVKGIDKGVFDLPKGMKISKAPG